MIDFNKGKARKIYRTDINVQRKRTKILKSKRGRTTKTYDINVKRKNLLKQKREKALQNAKDRKLARANRASNDTQNITNTAAAIDDANTDAPIDADNMDNAAIDADNIDNAAIDADNIDNAAIDADNIDNAAIDTDNTDNAATDREKSDDAAMSDTNIDNAVTGSDHTDKAVTGKASTVHVPLPPHSKGKTKDPSQIKTSSKLAIPNAEPSTGDPLPEGHDTAKTSGHTVDLTDVHIYEFLIQGTPNPLDLEGIEEDQLLEIQ